MSFLNEREKDWLRDHASKVSRPFYAFFASRVRERVARLREVFPEGTHLHYSLKSNPNPELVRLVTSLGLGADVASLGELNVARSAGVKNENISFVGPAKTDAELEAAQGVLLVVESPAELARVRGGDVLLRVNPARYFTPSGKEVSAEPSAFGIDEESLPLAIPSGVRWRGVHVFSGGQHLGAESIARNLLSTLELHRRLSSHGLDVVDLGGGFGIPYFAGQRELDLAKLKSLVFEPIREELKRGTKVIVESGRFIAGPSGVYVARVVARKVSRGRTYLMLEGGMNHHLAAVGFGQAVRRNFPITALKDGPTEKVTLAGPTCYALDVLGADVELPKLDAGDHVVIGQSGAYGASFSPSGFLSFPAADEILVSAL